MQLTRILAICESSRIRDRIKECVAMYSNLELIGIFDTGIIGLENIEATSPDIVLVGSDVRDIAYIEREFCLS